MRQPRLTDAVTDAAADVPARRGQTPAEVARYLRVNGDRVRGWIKAGELGAIDTARHRCGRPRYIVLPEHLVEFVRRRQAATPAARPAPRRRRPPDEIDFFPD